VYVPAATVATVNPGALRIVPPSVIVQDGPVVTIVPETVQGFVPSLGANPLPVTVTVVPAGPEVRLRAIDGLLTTLKVVDCESPVLPAT
jgi:hypothetical protein